MERFWVRWLLVASVVTAAVGVLLAAAAGTPLLAPLEGPLLRSVLGDGVVAPEVRTLHRWTFGVTGGVLLGWGVYAYHLVLHGLARGEAWAWRGLSLGIVLWFLVDSGASAAHGVWLNVAANVGFLLLFGIPLAAVAPRHLGRPAHGPVRHPLDGG